MEPHIGMQLWQFNQNRRVYKKDADGRSVGGPIWREHWEPVLIVGETRVSWLVGPEWIKDQLHRADKIPKAKFPAGYATSEEEINKRAWVGEWRHALADKVRSCTDYDTLKVIEATLASKSN